MKYFLTSSAYKVLDRIFDNQDLKDIKRLAFIDTAADLYSDDKKQWLFDDRQKLLDLGLEVKDYTLVNKSKKQIQNDLNNFDAIFVGGGNTFYLNYHATKSGFNDLIKSNQLLAKYYFGSSAGSVLLSKSLAPIASLDDPNKSPEIILEGMGILPYTILPHWVTEKFKPRFLEAFKKATDTQIPLMSLGEQDYMIIENEKMSVVTALG